MFEAHFGFSAPPFQLSPDPSFYFESKGHGQALSYLKYGVYQREGFIVVTGDIGSGKTTLVKALLDGLDSREVMAAQVVSTQLDTYGLLHAICTAFGVQVLADDVEVADLTSEHALQGRVASQKRRGVWLAQPLVGALGDRQQDLQRGVDPKEVGQPLQDVAVQRPHFALLPLVQRRSRHAQQRELLGDGEIPGLR